MAAVGCPKMMSFLLFYHKKENPLTGVIDSEGRWAQAVLLRIVLCVEDNFSTSETREPKSWCPAASCREAVKKPKPRGGGCIGASFPPDGGVYPGTLPGR